MNYFLSCDWGTSAFRLRLVDRETLAIIAYQETQQGCATANREWLESNQSEDGRMNFYLRILAGEIEKLEQQSHLTQVPVIISGMASSTAGMINLPYKTLPFLADGSDLISYQPKPVPFLNNRVMIISGLRTQNDVMRGEETKLVGYLTEVPPTSRILILPGTHPKHVYIDKKEVTDFKTFMTGEFFELLATKSLLALSVTPNSQFDESSFTAGLLQGATGNLLHNSFMVRTNTLFESYTSEKNYHYLSGLLIGTELHYLTATNIPVTLLENETGGSVYRKALEILKIPVDETVNADAALVKGHAKLIRKL
jgi:2-dehydro-3-deoxygalactonokinase